MLYVGDKSQCYNTGLEEALTALHKCPTCGSEGDVLMEYDPLQRMSFPVAFEDTQCMVCGEYMDRIYR